MNLREQVLSAWTKHKEKYKDLLTKKTNLFREKEVYKTFILDLSKPENETLILIKGDFDIYVSVEHERIKAYLGKSFQFREIKSYKVDNNQLLFTSRFRGQNQQHSFPLKGGQLTLGRLLPSGN